jgi:hypothetical protein
MALRTKPQSNKTTDMPVGISGPFVSTGKGRVMFAELGVVLPVYGQPSRIKKIYIGSVNTYSPERYRAAEARAIELRDQAVKTYERDAKRAQKRA